MTPWEVELGRAVQEPPLAACPQREGRRAALTQQTLKGVFTPLILTQALVSY